MLINSTFFKKAGVLAGGTAVAQAINIVSLPILSRIYTPADFGIYAVFLVLSSIGAVFGTLKYENAIIAVDTDEEAKECTIFILRSSPFIILLLLVLSLLAVHLIFQQYSHYNMVLIGSALMIIFTSNFQALYYFNNRMSKYSLMTRGRMYAAAAIFIVSISVGLFHSGFEGLIVGSVSGSAVNFFYLWSRTKELSFRQIMNGWESARNAAKKNIRFPKNLIISSFIDRLSSQFHTLVFARYFSAGVAGSVSLHHRVVSLPTSIIGNAVGDVFKRDASDLLRNQGNCKELFLKTGITLFAIAIIPTIVLALFAPDLFVFVFGDNWKQAGEFSQVLSLPFLFGFVVSPLSSIIYLEDNQKYDIFLQGTLLFLLVASMTYAVSTKNEMIAVIAFAASYCIKYTIELIISYLLSTKSI